MRYLRPSEADRLVRRACIGLNTRRQETIPHKNQRIFALRVVVFVVSHSVVRRAATALRTHPVDILTWIFNVARLAVDAVLGVNLQPHLPLLAAFQRDVLVHA